MRVRSVTVSESTGRYGGKAARPDPFEAMQADTLRQVDLVLTDIDDTLTTGGKLPALAYAALERLTAAGLHVIPVTGRPAGWCDLIARLWPVSAVVGENGAFYFACEPAGGMTRVYAREEVRRREDRKHLDDLSERILSAVPAARLSADQAYRESDLAIDFAEDGPRLEQSEIDCIVACFREAGATAKVSSIHVNGWFGTHDKLVMTRRLLLDRFGLDIEQENRRVLFVGDSPNDAPMFGFFDNSVAVANFATFQDHVREQPKWLTRQPGGSGFAEVAAAILKARSRQ